MQNQDILDSIIKPKSGHGQRHGSNLPRSDMARAVDDTLRSNADAVADATPPAPKPAPAPLPASVESAVESVVGEQVAQNTTQSYQKYDAMPWDQVLRSGAMNAPKNAYEIVDGLAKFVAYMLTPRPLLLKDEWKQEQSDLYKALAYLSVGALYKGLQTQKDRRVGAVGFSAYPMFAPLLERPQVKKWLEEPAALFDATIQMYKDNYGLGQWGMAGLKRYIAEQPMDLAADIAAVATLGLKGATIGSKAGSATLRSTQLQKLRFDKFFNEKLIKSLPRLPVDEKLLARVKSAYEKLPDVLDMVGEKARYIGTGVEGGSYPPGYWAKIAYYTLMGLDIGNAPALAVSGAAQGAARASEAAERARRIYDIKAIEDVARQLHIKFHHRRQMPPPKDSYTLDEAEAVHRNLQNTKYRAFTGLDGYLIQNLSLVDFRPVNFAFLRVDDVDDLYAPFVFSDAYQPAFETVAYHLKEGYTNDEVQEMFQQYYRQGKIKLLEDMSHEELADVGVTRFSDFNAEDFPIKALKSNEFINSITVERLPPPRPSGIDLGWEYQRRLWGALEDIEGGLAKHLGNAKHPIEIATQHVVFKNKLYDDIYSGFQEKYKSIPSKQLYTGGEPSVFATFKQAWEELESSTNFTSFVESRDGELYRYIEKYLHGKHPQGLPNRNLSGQTVADIEFVRERLLGLFGKVGKRKNVATRDDVDPSMFMHIEKLLGAVDMDYYLNMETLLGDPDTWSSLDSVLLLRAHRKAIGLPNASPRHSEIFAVTDTSRAAVTDMDIVDWMRQRMEQDPPNAFTKQYSQRFTPAELDVIFADFKEMRATFREDLAAAKQSLIDASDRVDQQYAERMMQILQNSSTTEARAVANILIDTDIDPDKVMAALDQNSLENVRVLVLNHIFENARNHKGITYRIASVNENPFIFHSEDIELGRVLDDLQYIAENPASEQKGVAKVRENLWSYLDKLSAKEYFHKQFSDDEKSELVELAAAGDYQEILDILHPPDTVRTGDSYVQVMEWDNAMAASHRQRKQNKKLQVKHKAIYTNPTAEIAANRWDRQWFVSDTPEQVVVIGFDGESIGIRGIPARSEWIYTTNELKNKYPGEQFTAMVKNRQVPWLPATELKAQLKRIGHSKLTKIFGGDGAELLYRMSDLTSELPSFNQGTYDDIAHYVRKGMSNLPTTRMLRDLTLLRKNVSQVGPIETLETLFHVIGDKNTRTFLRNPASVGLVLQYVPTQLKQQVRSWLSDYATVVRQVTRQTTQERSPRRTAAPRKPVPPMRYGGRARPLERLGGRPLIP